ncbi:type II secretion system protein G [Anaerohalosphaera lusitana]|uniref:Type II secretion system protein G n=1 Tax=Anaerohalosphaera lusitana TaxID=1936003 RepID=A0A1U9NME5_9BACT|nr:type II secretion system protein [Anaerohalosphaera lusitana]AQT69122.1 type II secretion system protein G [Anaerohalosphaera lusitana]
MLDQKRKAFTLIELLVVIAIIALLMSIMMPALSKVKGMARRVVCGNNVKQINLGTHLYASQNNDKLPLNESGFWYWDISYYTTDFLMDEGGMVKETFYCPADRVKSKEQNMEKFWRYSEAVMNDGKVPEREEETDTTWRRQNYRVMSYFYIAPRADGSVRGFDPVDVDLHRKLSAIKNASSFTLFSDAVLQDRNTEKFTDIVGGSAAFGLMDNTSHIKNNGQPQGGNAGFADGHVEWVKYDDMIERNPDKRNMPAHYW